ncbi:MAG: hypothetical protein Aurels2KO_57760 [Aureliella sp.]
MADDTCHTCDAVVTSTSDSKPYTSYCPNCGVLGVVTDSLIDSYGDADIQSTGSDWFRDIILKRIPDADVRIDQCTTIRVYWRDVVAAIRPLDSGGYHVSAGDALAQSENITFEMSASSDCQSDWDAIHCLVEYCLTVVSQR